MKKVLLFPVKAVAFLCKAAAVVLIASMIFGFLLPNRGVVARQGCESCQVWTEKCAALEEECIQLREALKSEYFLQRRIDLQFFPELGLDWLRIRTVDFWGNVGYSHYEAYPEGAEEVIWTSGIIACSFVTVDRSVNP